MLSTVKSKRQETHEARIQRLQEQRAAVERELAARMKDLQDKEEKEQKEAEKEVRRLHRIRAEIVGEIVLAHVDRFSGEKKLMKLLDELCDAPKKRQYLGLAPRAGVSDAVDDIKTGIDEDASPEELAEEEELAAATT